MIIAINPKNPQKRLIKKVVEVLEKGGVIGYPTDTIYGVGCDLSNPEAIQKIHRLKKIDSKKPLSFICSDLKDISRYAYVSNYAYKIVKRLLPGRLYVHFQGDQARSKDSHDETEYRGDSNPRQ